MRCRSAVLFCGLLMGLLPGAALAHPGHGMGEGWSALHILTSPIHAGGILLAAAVAGVAWRWILRDIRRDRVKDRVSTRAGTGM